MSLILKLFLAAGATTAEPQKAELSTVVMVGLMLVSAYASYALQPKGKVGGDTKPQPFQTVQVERGSRLKVISGYERVKDPIVNWLGDGRVAQEPTGQSAGKGLGGGSTQQTQTVYYESASVLLGTGPGYSLGKIIVSGEILWQGPIDRYNTPSGTSVATNRGTFVIYWGEKDGPIDEVLGEASRFGIRSRWPLFFRIRWVDFALGPQSTWPQIDYEVLCKGGTRLSKSEPFMEVTDASAEDTGVNPAHAAFQFTTAKWPHGGGALDILDQESLEDCGLTAEREHTPCRVTANDNDTVADVISRLCSDHGWMCVQDGDRLLLRKLRVDTSAPYFGEDLIVQPTPPSAMRQGDSQVDRMVYTYTDRTLAWTTKEVRFDDDAESRQWDRRRPLEVDMPTITDRLTAVKAASRKQLEAFSDLGKLEIQLPFTACNLLPGSPFKVEGYGNQRVTSIRQEEDSAMVTITSVPDAFTTRDSGFLAGSAGNTAGYGPPVKDLAFATYELPWQYVGDDIALGVLRVRGNRSIGPATVWVSLDGTTYFTPGAQKTFAIGGILREAITGLELPIIEEGPRFAAQNDDVLDALDLSADPNAWLNGRQLCMIDNELYFARKITPIEGEYRLDGLVPAMSGTVKSRHDIGAQVYVFLQNSIIPIRDSSFLVGASVRIKTQPAGVDLSTVVPDTETIDGLARAPFPVHNVGCLHRSFGDRAVISSAVSSFLVLDGDWTRVFEPGFWAWVAKDSGVTHKAFYRVTSTSLSGYQTTVTLESAVTHTPEADDRLYVASIGTTYVAGDDAVLTWTFSSRFTDGQAAGEQGYGSQLSSTTAVREGTFTLQILSILGAAVRSFTVDSNYPEVRYTAAMRTTDFGSDPASFTFRVRNTLGAFSSEWTYATVYKE